MIMTKEQFLKYPRKRMIKAKPSKPCPLCKKKMRYNYTFKEYYCLRCGKFLPDIQRELWDCFSGKNERNT
jgi:hypothetical protein